MGEVHDLAGHQVGRARVGEVDVRSSHLGGLTGTTVKGRTADTPTLHVVLAAACRLEWRVDGSRSHRVDANAFGCELQGQASSEGDERSE